MSLVATVMAMMAVGKEGPVEREEMMNVKAGKWEAAEREVQLV